MRLCLEVDVPLCSLRPFTARDFQESLPVPPPSTAIGLCLSLMGRERSAITLYRGNKIALAVRPGCERSLVLRKMRRDPANPKKKLKGIPQFRPEYQELLVDLRFWVLLDDEGAQERSLAADVKSALEAPERVVRYGAVSLGESAFLVDAVRVTGAPANGAEYLVPRKDGDLSLPLQVDFSARPGTRLQRFSLEPGPLESRDFIEVPT